MAVSDVIIVDYEEGMASEINEVWRTSFNQALGLQQRFDSAEGQLVYLKNVLVKESEVLVLLERSTTRVIGFMAFKSNVIEQLYLHPDFQGMGHGRKLVDIAKTRSSGELQLYTFQANQGAQQFYIRMGFSEVSRGSADMKSNPWAKSQSQLADILYVWRTWSGKKHSG
ncbi:MAG: ribosomal protein S18 acetylase RimI-like enzyme [Candidatus Azotimanducaceae bacterium]|jgi:ribosomal protein S18 acetylase RimI-like enzyme